MMSKANSKVHSLLMICVLMEYIAVHRKLLKKINNVRMVFIEIINYLKYFFQDNVKSLQNQWFIYNFILTFCLFLIISFRNKLTAIRSLVSN